MANPKVYKSAGMPAFFIVAFFVITGAKPVVPNLPDKSFYQSSQYFVLAHSGLSVRKQPDSKSEKRGLLPYNATVQVLEFTKVKSTFQGLENYWAKVNFEGKTGYIFSGFLSRLKGPKYDIRSIKDYAFATFRQTEKTHVIEEGGTEERQSDAYLKQLITKFEKNIILSEYTGYESFGERLYLPDYTFQEAFLIGVNMDSRYKDFEFKLESDEYWKDHYYQCIYGAPDGCVDQGDCLHIETDQEMGLYVAIGGGC